MSKIALPYCYKIIHKTTNQFYIGFRSGNSVKAYKDLGFKYFTSSKTVKELGFENFKIDWIEEFENHETAYKFEQLIIFESFKDPLCLNKNCTFGKQNKFSTSGTKRVHSEETKKKISNSLKGFRHSEKSKLKMSKSQKGIPKPKSEETKLKLSKSHKGKKLSKEHKNKISIATRGENNPMFGKKHKPFSTETKLKMSESAKGKPKQKVKCQHCNTLVPIHLIKRWHNDNCKHKIYKVTILNEF